MSNVGGGIVERARNWGTNIWILILLIALVVLVADLGATYWLSSQETSARSLVSDTQLLSQQLSVQAKDAVGGDASAFAAFKDTRDAIDTKIKNLQDGSFTAGVPSYKNSIGISRWRNPKSVWC